MIYIPKKLNRIGEINYNKHGSRMEIIEYNDSFHLKVKFENGYMASATYQRFKNGNIRNPYDKNVFGIGFVGEGIYQATENRIPTKIYNTWYDMMKRCYDYRWHQKRPTYMGCTVCLEWHNFQVFAKWYQENYYEIDGEVICLDKDILVKGNKIYSATMCVFAPKRINSLFVKCDLKRGYLPIGVSFDKGKCLYIVKCRDINGRPNILATLEILDKDLAFNIYKKYKEQTIKQIADEYKSRIPNKLYEAMYKYKVEMDD